MDFRELILLNHIGSDVAGMMLLSAFISMIAYCVAKKEHKTIPLCCGITSVLFIIISTLTCMITFVESASF